MRLAIIAGAVLCTGCGGSDPLMELLPSERTGITFRNEIEEREGLNVLVYEYFYNGGGVAAGDVNGDGRPDLYFTANMGPNALYLNEGDMRFRNVTEEAGVAGSPGWTTGVVMADVNGDGLLDIYVCKSGRVSEPLRRNELFINNGDGTFTERASAFGLDDPSYSTHATFFDYDLDGDLDLFLVNHPVERYSRFDVELMRQARDPLAGDKLYRNDGGTYVDVSVESGIFGNPIGFGLSAVAADLNGDGYPDLFVANDYVEDDYLYVNNGDGTFTEELRSRFDVTSYSSMGTDVADVNNDGYLDILTLDMMPEEPVRRKLLQGPVDHETYTSMLGHGYFRQHMRNMLQLNTGDGTFQEIGRLAGVAETDWSWAPLLADLNNDGRKDLFVTNGYFRDYTDQDFLTSALHNAMREARATGRPVDSDSLTRLMPQTPIANYAFENVDGLTFRNTSREWGVDQPAFSNGAVYADLDLDGDLDLVVNNINREAFVYRNAVRRDATGDSDPDRRFLRVELEGPPGNRFGIGARVEIEAKIEDGDGRRYVQEMQSSRGYLSSVEPVLHFGLGGAASVDIHVVWPGGARGTIPGVETNGTLTLAYADARMEPGGESGDQNGGRTAAQNADQKAAQNYFVFVPDRLGLDFIHQENSLVDFEAEPLLPHLLSREGPATATGDVNGDGLEDFFAGGARGQPAALYLQQADGTFRRAAVPAFDEDAGFEDVAALFFDADADGDLDLYVVSGGAWETSDGSAYQDRLYRNAGFGQLERTDALPPMPTSGGAVAAHDVDGDGDLDLFVGGRVTPGRYPESPRSYLLLNDGGRFREATPEPLRHPGMVTAAVWADLHPDTEGHDLAVAGEWMPVRIYSVAAPAPSSASAAMSAAPAARELGLAAPSGWWRSLHAADLDGDGDVDLIAGNEGRNHELRPDDDAPVVLFAGDFNFDGRLAPILTYQAGGGRYPIYWRDELFARIPRLRRDFPDYESYARATIDELFSRDQMQRALRLEARTFASSVLENLGDGSFRRRDLPVAAQLAPVRDVVTVDVDRDGLVDVLIAGNNYGSRVQWGPQAAGRGMLLLNEGDLAFRALPPAESGLLIAGDTRRLELVNTTLGTLLVAAQNDGVLETFGVNYGSSAQLAAVP